MYSQQAEAMFRKNIGSCRSLLKPDSQWRSFDENFLQFSNCDVFFSAEITDCERVEDGELGRKYFLAKFKLKFEVVLDKNTEKEDMILLFQRPTELKFERILAEDINNNCLHTHYLCNTANPYYNFFGDSIVRILNRSCRFRHVFDS